MPVDLQIETTSTCQAACHFCPYPKMNRFGGLMDRHLFEKIIDEASTIDVIEGITITGLGEPTLDPHLVRRVAFARSRMPGRTISIFTNGEHMTPSRFEALRDSGMTHVVFSLNAVSQEQHERVMALKGKFDIVCKNIDHAILNAYHVRVRVTAVLNADMFTPEDAPVFYKRWGHQLLNGHGQVVNEGNWMGDNRTIRDFDPNSTCHRAISHMYVMYDGRVSTCCFDPSGKMVFGDLTTQTIREVYNGDAYLTFRAAHWENRAAVYDICRTCTRI